MVLDEVTTHLDSDTVLALVEALKQFQGALLVITHDRYVLAIGPVLLINTMKGSSCDVLLKENHPTRGTTAMRKTRKKRPKIRGMQNPGWYTV